MQYIYSSVNPWIDSFATKADAEGRDKMICQAITHTRARARCEEY